MDGIAAELLQALESRGWQARIVASQHCEDLRRAILGGRERGEFDQRFAEERLSPLSFGPPEGLRDARSLLIVAVPSPQTRLVFTWRGERRALILPPTYVQYRATGERVVAHVAAFLEPWGFEAVAAALPLKLLAVSAGLGDYGKNNLCYVPGMGSFLQLAACYSDLPCPQDAWREPREMPACASCRACERGCPPRAIGSDRFLLRAERCLTFHNESAARFPEWLHPSWHHCLFGCLHCQRTCPVNKPFFSWVEEGGEFSQEETFLLLRGTAIDALPSETVAKWTRLGLSEDLALVPRNLAAVLAQE